MKDDPISSLLKLLFVLALFVLPPLIKLFRGRARKPKMLPAPHRHPSTPRRLKPTARQTAAPTPAQARAKKIEDVLSGLFGGEPREEPNIVASPHPAPPASRQPAPEMQRPAPRPQRRPRPERKPFFKPLEVSKPHLEGFPISVGTAMPSLEEFETTIQPAPMPTQARSPIHEQLIAMSRNDWQKAIVLREVLGPPLSLR